MSEEQKKNLIIDDMVQDLANYEPKFIHPLDDYGNAINGYMGGIRFSKEDCERWYGKHD